LYLFLSVTRLLNPITNPLGGKFRQFWVFKEVALDVCLTKTARREGCGKFIRKRFKRVEQVVAIESSRRNMQNGVLSERVFPGALFQRKKNSIVCLLLTIPDKAK
jgi:hypothetical protein